MSRLIAQLTATALAALAIFAGGAIAGAQWQARKTAKADLAAATDRAADTVRQAAVNEQNATDHAQALATIHSQLKTAHEKIALLSGRKCFELSTVRMLNAVGSHDPVPAPASEPAGAPATPAADGGNRFATEREAATAIAICRARYGEVASQVNQILDIEDARQAGR